MSTRNVDSTPCTPGGPVSALAYQKACAYAALLSLGDSQGAALLLAELGPDETRALGLLLGRWITATGNAGPALVLAGLALDLAALEEAA
jgi:hypothetical protein